MKWIIEKHQEGMSVRDYLQIIQGLSRRILISVKSEKGGIWINGRKETVRKILNAGDQLEIKFPPEKVSSWLIPETMDLTIVYEDKGVLVLNKQRGLATMPSPKHKSQTLANGVLGYYKKSGNPNTIHVVTRLDRDTSGLVLIAKDRLSHSLLSKSQKQFTIKRKYVAIVHGEIKWDNGTIDAPIRRKSDSIIEREVGMTGKESITHYKVVKRWRDYTLVDIELETGRTHQIRVHFSHINHPLVGDDLYGGNNHIFPSQALHCSSLRFEEPYSKEVKEFYAEIPTDMARFIQKLNRISNQKT